jgi:hypothetical protein
MAVPAIDAVVSGVMQVAELNRLLDVGVLIGEKPSNVEQRDHATEGEGEKAESNDTEPGIDVGVTMEELTHRVDVRVVPRLLNSRVSLRAG